MMTTVKRLRSLVLILMLLALPLVACTAAPDPETVLDTGSSETPDSSEDAGGEEADSVAATRTVPAPTIAPPPTAPPATIELRPTLPPEPAATDEPSVGGVSGEWAITDELRLEVVGQYGGVPQAVAIAENTALVGFGPRLLALDVSDPANIGQLGRSEPLPGLVEAIAIAEGVAYVAVEEAGLLTLDVADPSAITLLNAGTAGESSNQVDATDVFLAGGCVYLLERERIDGHTTLQCFDASDPADPVLVRSAQLGPYASAVAGEDVLLVIVNGQAELREATDANQVLATIPLEKNGYAAAGLLQGDTLMLVESGERNGISRYDIADPSGPALLDRLDDMEFFFLNDVVGDEEALYAFGTFGEFGFCSSQVISAQIGDEGMQPGPVFDPENCATDMTINGDVLYVAGLSGLQSYDVSDPLNPLLLGQFRHPDGFQDGQGVTFADGVMHVLTGEGRGFDLATVDVGVEPAVPLGESFPFAQEPMLDLLRMGDILVAPVWMGGIYTLDVSEPADPRLLYTPKEGDLAGAEYYSVVLDGDVLYVPIYEGELIGPIGAYDLSDPANPTIAGVAATGEPQVLSLELGEGVLYALTQGDETQLHVIDISRPLDPDVIGQLTLPGFPSRLVVTGDTLLAACDGWNCQGLYAIDVSDPAQPALRDEWALPFRILDVVADEAGIVYFVTQEDGIWALAGHDEGNARLVGHLSLPDVYPRLRIVGDMMYGSASGAGVYEIAIVR